MMRSLMKLFGLFHEEDGADAILEARLCALCQQSHRKLMHHAPVSPFRAGRAAV